jgi:hypothetical protein
MFLGVTPANERFDAYKAKIRAYAGTGSAPDYTPPVVQGKLAQMYRRAQKAFAEQASYQMQVSTLLAAAGTPMTLRAGYQAFAGEMYKLCNKYTSADLVAYAAILVTKWTSRGLDAAYLGAIRTDVFGVGAPE